MRAIAISVTLLCVSASAAAQTGDWGDSSDRGDDPTDDIRGAFYFLLGMGGEADTEVDPDIIPGNEVDLDPTVGFGVRVERPMLPFLTLGALPEFGAIKAGGADPAADSALDLAPLAPGRSSTTLDRTMSLEIYGAIPFGYSYLRLEDNDILESPHGFNLGVLVGAQLFIGRIGVMTEFGWRRHQLYDEEGDFDIEMTWNQAALNFGAVMLL